MDLFLQLAQLTKATPDHPIVLGNVEFWIDPIGPWAGQLAFDTPTSQWDAKEIGVSVAYLATVYPEINGIVAQHAN